MKSIKNIRCFIIIFAAFVCCFFIANSAFAIDEKNEKKKTTEEKKDKSGEASTKETSKEEPKSVKYYTSYNLWFEKPESLSSINYKKGAMIMAGTEVENVSIFENRVIFETIEPPRTFTIKFSERHHPGLTIKQFRNRLFVTSNFEEQTKDFTPSEIQNIKEGVVGPDMSKKAVLMAYGYPPEHATFSLKNQKWTYWINRFLKQEILFDENEKTKDIKPADND